jgi:hypothetical protein
MGTSLWRAVLASLFLAMCAGAWASDPAPALPAQSALWMTEREVASVFGRQEPYTSSEVVRIVLGVQADAISKLIDTAADRDYWRKEADRRGRVAVTVGAILGGVAVGSLTGWILSVLLVRDK